MPEELASDRFFWMYFNKRTPCGAVNKLHRGFFLCHSNKYMIH
jgi:hypothetical protein